MTETVDLEEQQEPEQFVVEDNTEMSREVKQHLREQKAYEKLKKKEEQKHKARFSRKDNMNGYLCDRCGNHFAEEDGSLIYKKEGEFAYCKECLKVLYPNHTFIKLLGSSKKLDFRSNHYDTKYFFKA